MFRLKVRYPLSMLKLSYDTLKSGFLYFDEYHLTVTMLDLVDDTLSSSPLSIENKIRTLVLEDGYLSLVLEVRFLSVNLSCRVYFRFGVVFSFPLDLSPPEWENVGHFGDLRLLVSRNYDHGS